ncbi:hypothetical protein BH10BAC4_BH10BAC4_09820 [soil metagenome]
MTTDRKKAILFLSITLVIGIFIGSLLPAFYGHFLHRQGGDGREWKDHRQGKDGRPPGDRKAWLTRSVIKVVQPDSNQVILIRSITQETTRQVGELEKNSNERMISIMDSMKIKLKPVLTEEQNKKLEEFSAKARSRWKGKH